MSEENAGQIIYRLTKERGFIEPIKILWNETRKETSGNETLPALLKRLGEEIEKNS